MDERAIADALRSSSLFADAPDAVLAGIARRFSRRRFRRGEVVFHQDDPGDSLHIVSSGSLKVVLRGTEGDEAIIATLHPGDFFGELSLLDGAPRSATVAAVEPSETLTLPRDSFRDLLDRDPAVRDALLAGLAHQMRRITGHVEELHFLDLPGRLAKRLTRLAREADPTSSVVRLDWPYTQSDLAAMIGGTRQSVNRLLGTLIVDGLVVLDRDVLVIPDVDALDRLATQ
jgi:CRP/FNR family transcriptional regulator/CRP/FNR family cyclic AMP-dependent transcriptional regulator